MKDSILKKIISLLLSVTLAVGMNGVPVWAEGSASPENGIAGHAADNVVFTVSVSVDGSPTEYKEYKQKEDFAQVWKDIQGKTAEIHLLQDLDVSNIYFYVDGDGGNNDENRHTLVVTAGNITLTMDNGVSLSNKNTNQNQLINVIGGTFILKSGRISSTGIALTVYGGNVYVEGGTLEGNTGIGIFGGIFGGDKLNVYIGNCTLKGNEYAVQLGEGLSVNDILANGFAVQKKNGDVWEWVTPNSNLNLKLKDTFQVRKFPIEFDKQPISVEAEYGSDFKLQAHAKITNKDELRNIETSGNITYQWQQKDKAGSWKDVDGAGGENFTPSGTLHIGTYQYRCRATYSGFPLNSEEVSIIVQPRTVSAEITGNKISKKYDGYKNVPKELLNSLSVKLTNVLPSDSVSGSAVRGEYDNEKPGEHKVIVEIEFDKNGDHCYENYKLSGNPYELKGEITGVLLNDDTLEAGTEKKLKYYIWPQPTDSSNSNVSWESSNPAVATVDENGKVTAVGAGNAVITVTVTTADGLMKATCNVTVSGAGNSGSASGGSTSGGSSGSPSTNVRIPFLTDRPYKRGWSIIQAEAEKAAAEPGSGPAYIDIDMNGTVLVPGRIFTAVKNKDVTLAFDMGGGISWSVCGKDITAETVSDTNLSVKAGGGVIPLDVLNRTAGDCAHLELSPAHNGPFGFTAALTIQTGKNENGIAIGAGDRATFAGMYANLYVYNASLRSLEFVCAEQVGEDGIVHLPVERASDFTVILSADPIGGTDTPEDPSGGQNEIEPEPENLPVGSVELSKTLYTYSGKAKKPAVTAVDTAGMQIPDKYYTVSYQNNIKVGKAAAVIVFKDGYSGTVEKAFTIRPAGTSIKKAAAVSGGFTLKWIKRTAQTSGYQIQYSRNSGFKGSSTNRVNVKKVSVTKKTVKKLKNGKKYYVRIRTYKKVKTGGTNARVYSAWSRAAALRVK